MTAETKAPSRTRPLGAVTTLALMATLVAGSHAQEPLGGMGGGWEVAPMFEQWSFGEGAREMVTLAQQRSVPLVMVAPIGRSVVLDAFAAWTSGVVRAQDGEGINRSYTLEGLSDVKLRATMRLRGDAVLLTMGVGLPTGRTELDAEEYAALRVLGAPSLRFHAPAIGTGLTATSGIVFTRQLAGWAWGFGASYEYRGDYAPLDAAAAGLETLNLDPGDAVRLTVGTDGLIGSGAMSMLASATLLGRDRVTSELGKQDFRFGPALALEWQLRPAVPGFSEVALYAYDRYRMEFRDGTGEKVPGSSGNELEAGARGVIRLGRAVALSTSLDGRHHTGLRVNEALSTAAMVGGGATLGLSISTRRLTFQPFIRAQAGRMQSGDARFSISGFAGGLTIGSRM